MTFANNLDPDEAPQNGGGVNLRSKLFDIQIIYFKKYGGKRRFLVNFEEKNI